MSMKYSWVRAQDWDKFAVFMLEKLKFSESLKLSWDDFIVY